MFAALIAAGLVVLPGEEASYDAMLVKHALDAAATYTGPCAEAEATRVSTEIVQIADQPDFAAQRERLRVEGCGRTSLQNLNVGRTGGSPPWLMVAGLPGESLADMSLQNDALPMALAQARTGIAPDCAENRVRDVYVAAKPGTVDFSGKGSGGRFAVALPPEFEALRSASKLDEAWVEVWPISFCGEDRTQAVVFMPLKDQKASTFLFLPVWEQLREHGPDALPAPARDTTPSS